MDPEGGDDRGQDLQAEERLDASRPDQGLGERLDAALAEASAPTGRRRGSSMSEWPALFTRRTGLLVEEEPDQDDHAEQQADRAAAQAWRREPGADGRAGQQHPGLVSRPTIRS